MYSIVTNVETSEDGSLSIKGFFCSPSASYNLTNCNLGQNKSGMLLPFGKNKKENLVEDIEVIQLIAFVICNSGRVYL